LRVVRVTLRAMDELSEQYADLLHGEISSKSDAVDEPLA
jgi:hypothetical protein